MSKVDGPEQTVRDVSVFVGHGNCTLCALEALERGTMADVTYRLLDGEL